ncbi:efflux RND transporter periplasmic adaptor subunit [Rheinheimera sp.]|uniref:efflux RND transporter periplasmic adaptor subunit n=1 Tax=Rheinheimera sp. TaxID=1869214 RepID=UPI00307DE199
MSQKHRIRPLLLGALAAAVLSACGQPSEQNPGAMQAPAVQVAEVVYETITHWDEFTGRLQAPQTVTLMPRVSGYIEKVYFEEGALVQQGDLLFQIDPRPFQAEVSRLKAELQSAQTAERLASNDYQRAAKLERKSAVSEEVLDTRLARKQQAIATVASVKAALDKAELDLSFTAVKAPISGKVSYAQITAGNFVTAGSSELTRLVSTSTMYAYFDADEQTFLSYQRQAQQGKNAAGSGTVYMALAGDSNFSHVGRIDFIDNAVNPQTGTIRARASFDNKDQQLIPGLFARIKLAGQASSQGVLIDDKAIGTDLSNKFVLVVDANNQLQYRAVTLGEKINGLRLIKDGLNAKDRIVVNGLQRVRPSMTISPETVPMASDEQIGQLRTEQQQLEQHQKQLTAAAANQPEHG